MSSDDSDLGRELYTATVRQEVDVIRELLARGAPLLTWRDSDGESVIHCAARHGHVNVAKIFLEHKVDVNIGDCTNRTPLHKAVGQRRPDMVRFLLNAKADINAKEHDGREPFARASPEMRQLLQEYQDEQERIERQLRQIKLTFTMIRSLEYTSVLSLLPNELLFEIFAYL